MLPYHDSQYQLFERSFLQSDYSSSPPHRPDPSPFFPLSPPTFDHDSFNELLLIPTPPSPTPPPEPPTIIKNMVSPTAPAKGLAGLGRRRALRKDRHSKINTAHGPRDRRMRLSLDVARRFFDLQDMLGLDKASRTVEWLLMKSQTAIKDLNIGSGLERRGGCSSVSAKSSSASEGEVISLNHDDKDEEMVATEANAPPKAKAKRVVTTRTLRKAATLVTLARESRLIARERARERTREKNMSLGRIEDSGRSTRVWNSIPFEATNGENSGTQDKNSSMEFDLEQPIINSPIDHYKHDAILEKADESLQLMMNGGSRLISIFDYDQNFVQCNDNLTILQEHWNNLHSSRNVEEQQRAALTGGIPFQTRPWEVFYNANL